MFFDCPWQKRKEKKRALENMDTLKNRKFSLVGKEFEGVCICGSFSF
jgi:hypothetical protein